MPDDPNAIEESLDAETMKYTCNLGYRYETTAMLEQTVSCCAYTGLKTLSKMCQCKY